MQSIYHFYKMNSQSIESLEAPMIYLANAKEWEIAGEFDFEMDMPDNEDYKTFFSQYLDKGFSLKPYDDGFSEFDKLRKSTLRKFSKEYLFGKKEEYDFLYNTFFDDAQTTKGLNERKSLIRNTFFNRTGVFCFTLDQMCFEKEKFWQHFAHFGNGFCVEYDFDELNEFLRLNEIGYGQPIDYKNQKAKLKILESDINKIKANYKEIIFSLNQDFSNEKEYRIFTIYESEIAKNDNQRKFFIPKKIVRSVIIGSEVNKTDSDLIKKIASEKLDCKKIYKMTNQFDYLHRSEI